MNEIELVQAIKHLKPTAEFSLKNNDYSTIKWYVLDGEAPTLAEIEAAHLQVQQAEAQAKAEAQAQKQAILDRLGLTEEELRIVLG